MTINYTWLCEKANDVSQGFAELEKALSECKESNNILSIDVIVNKDIFDDVFLPLLGRLDYYQSGFINSYKVIKNEVQILKEDIFPDEMTIKKPTIIFFPIEDTMVIHLQSELVIMSEVKGTIIFENAEAKLIAKKLDNAKLVHPSGSFFPCTIDECNLSYKEDLCAIFP